MPAGSGGQRIFQRGEGGLERFAVAVSLGAEGGRDRVDSVDDLGPGDIRCRAVGVAALSPSDRIEGCWIDAGG